MIRIRARLLAAVGAIILLPACGQAPLASSALGSFAIAAQAGLRGAARPNEPMRLHPLSLHFSSPRSGAKDAYVEHYGYGGTFEENCFTQGIAEFDGDGLEGKTGVFVAIPMAAGTCQATFHKRAQSLTLQITVGHGKAS